MNEKQITDIESYKAVTGAKRFKRTKEEIALGLSPEDALKIRLAESKDNVSEGGCTDVLISRKSGITIQIRAATKVDSDYFEHVPTKTVEIVLDEHWYKWYDELVSGPFKGDASKLLSFIMNQGIGEVLTKCHFPEDVEKMEGVRQVEETVLKTAGS